MQLSCVKSGICSEDDYCRSGGQLGGKLEPGDGCEGAQVVFHPIVSRVRPHPKLGEIPTCCDGQWACVAAPVRACIRLSAVAPWCSATKFLSCQAFGGLQMKEGMQHSITEETEQNFTGKDVAFFLPVKFCC